MQTYFARQPIMDSNLRLFAYELLYRSGPHADSAGRLLDGNRATAAVMEAFQTLGISKITGGKKAFVNFSGQLLLDGVPAFFSPGHLVIEVLENIEPTAALIEALTMLKKKGFTIALDDFEYKPDYQPLVDLADIIKIDFLEGVFTMKNLQDIISHANMSRCVLLAEKVESRETFEKALQLGCRLFQGYFFAKPANMCQPAINMTKMNCMRLIAEASRAEVDFPMVARIIKSDLSLSLRVLKLVNSAYFSLPNEIRDILQAVVILGARELKKWVSFVSLSDLCVDKPAELVQMSLTRAHFCEKIAVALGRRKDGEAFFLTGMFSLLEVMMACDMEVILREVMVPELTRSALLDPHNAGRYTIDLIVALERGQWDAALRGCKKLRLDSGMVSALYVDALRWSNDLYTV